MKQINKQKLLEQMVYLVIWLTVISVPLVGDYLFASISPVHTFSWRTIRMAWLLTLPFILLLTIFWLPGCYFGNGIGLMHFH